MWATQVGWLALACCCILGFLWLAWLAIDRSLLFRGWADCLARRECAVFDSLQGIALRTEARRFGASRLRRRIAVRTPTLLKHLCVAARLPQRRRDRATLLYVLAEHTDDWRSAHGEGSPELELVLQACTTALGGGEREAVEWAAVCAVRAFWPQAAPSTATLLAAEAAACAARSVTLEVLVLLGTLAYHEDLARTLCTQQVARSIGKALRTGGVLRKHALRLLVNLLRDEGSTLSLESSALESVMDLQHLTSCEDLKLMAKCALLLCTTRAQSVPALQKAGMLTKLLHFVAAGTLTGTGGSGHVSALREHGLVALQALARHRPLRPGFARAEPALRALATDADAVIRAHAAALIESLLAPCTGPLSLEEAAALPTRRAGGGDCAVCLGPLDPGGPCADLPCGHEFHPACVRRWSGVEASCPLCRGPLVAAAARQSGLARR